MFILGKQKILMGGEDIAELAYLLYACLYWVIMLCPGDVQCGLLESKNDSATILCSSLNWFLNFRI